MREEDVEKYKRFFLERNTANLLRLKQVREGITYFLNRDFYFFNQKFTTEFEELFEFTNIHIELILDPNIDEDTYNKEISRFNFEFGRKIVKRAKNAGIPAREYYIQWENYQHITDKPMLVEEVTETGEVKYFSPYSGSIYNHILSRYHGFFKNQDKDKDKDKTMHIVLLGDSIFDNGSYLQTGQPDVIAQLQKYIPKSTLSAVDGSVISSIFSQIQDIPKDATHLVISVGGNDCLQATSILYESSTSVGDGIMKLQPVVEKFQKTYEKMLQLLLKLNLPITVCTIYEPQYTDPTQQKIILTALKLFNDIILSIAIKEGIPVIDLRIVCSNPQDFANPIEPSEIGGSKIADCIARITHQHDFSSWRCSIYS